MKKLIGTIKQKHHFIPFAGQYLGKTVQEVLDTDPHYLLELVEIEHPNVAFCDELIEEIKARCEAIENTCFEHIMEMWKQVELEQYFFSLN